jgi:hypothetical protein
MSARVAKRRTLNEIAHVLNAVVTCSVKFENVVTVTAINRPARIADAARFSVFGFFAVEYLGQNASSRGFAGTSWPRKQICLAFAMVDNRILQRTNHVLLTLEFVKAAGAVAAI